MSRRPIHTAAVALAGLALTIAAATMFAPEAEAQSLEQVPTAAPCRKFTTDCNASGVCTGAVPDGGNVVGMPAADARSYYLYACPPRYQTITATGSFDNYHCHGNGKCPKLPGNTQTITAATTNPIVSTTLSDGGVVRSAGEQGCWESQPFEVPYADKSADRMAWVPNGITLGPTPDGGDLDLYVCPAK